MAKASIVVKKNNGGTIALNKRARHDYFIEEKFEAGLSLNQKGYSCAPLACYWKGPHAKLEIALVKGKQLHDKRATEKDRDWQRDKARIFHK